MADVAALIGVIEGVRDDFADEIEFALELVLIADALRATDEQLAMQRLGRLDCRRQLGVVDRHGAPAEEVETFLADQACPDAFAVGAQPLVLRQEDVADGIVAELRYRDLQFRAFLAQERVGDLDQDAGAVAHQRVGADCTAVLEVLENFERIGDDLVARARLQVDDETDAAGIDLAFRIKQPLRGGDGLARAIEVEIVGHVFIMVISGHGRVTLLGRATGLCCTAKSDGGRRRENTGRSMPSARQAFWHSAGKHAKPSTVPFHALGQSNRG